jgi:hypothetical protein
MTTTEATRPPCRTCGERPAAKDRRECWPCSNDRRRKREGAKVDALRRLLQRIGNDRDRMQDCITATHEILDGADIPRAHHAGGLSSLEARVEMLVRGGDVLASMRNEAAAERDTVRQEAAALRVGRDAVIAERDNARAMLEAADATISVLKEERDAAKDDCDALYAELSKAIAETDKARDALHYVTTLHGEADRRAERLVRRLRLAWLTIALLAVACVGLGLRVGGAL